MTLHPRSDVAGLTMSPETIKSCKWSRAWRMGAASPSVRRTLAQLPSSHHKHSFPKHARSGTMPRAHGGWIQVDPAASEFAVALRHAGSSIRVRQAVEMTCPNLHANLAQTSHLQVPLSRVTPARVALSGRDCGQRWRSAEQVGSTRTSRHRPCGAARQEASSYWRASALLLRSPGQ